MRLADLPRAETIRCLYDEEALSGRDLTCPKCRRSFGDALVVENGQAYFVAFGQKVVG